MTAGLPMGERQCPTCGNGRLHSAPQQRLPGADWWFGPLTGIVVVAFAFGLLGLAGLACGSAVALWRWLLGI